MDAVERIWEALSENPRVDVAVGKYARVNPAGTSLPPGCHAPETVDALLRDVLDDEDSRRLAEWCSVAAPTEREGERFRVEVFSPPVADVLRVVVTKLPALTT